MKHLSVILLPSPPSEAYPAQFSMYVHNVSYYSGLPHIPLDPQPLTFDPRPTMRDVNSGRADPRGIIPKQHHLFDQYYTVPPT